MLTIVVSGMIYILNMQSATSAWIELRISAGGGIGLGSQTPMTAGQNLVASEHISTTTRVLMFWQTLGDAIIVQAGQSSVTNKLVQSLIDCTPPLDSDIVIAVGATNIRSTFDEALLPGLFDAYMYGLETEFVLSIALSGCAVVVRAFTPWTKVEGKKLRSSA
jgi:hypothetical protein